MNQGNPTQSGGERIVGSARAQAIAQIAQQAHEAVAADMAAFNEDTGEIIPGSQADVAADAAASDAGGDTAASSQQERPELAAANTAAAPADSAGCDANAGAQDQPSDESEDDLETIIVDGQPLKVSRKQIVEAGRRTLQKEVAADLRLQEATRLRNEWLARITGSALPAAAGVPGNSQPPGEGVGVSPQQSDSHPATTGVDPTALDQRIAEQIYLREAERAAQEFAKEFPEIVNDPILMRMAVQMENERLAHAQAVGEPLGDPMAAYRAHGEAIMARIGRVQKTSQDDKALRKQSITSVPAASARAPAPETARPPTTSEVIAQMRKARHQRVA